MSDHTSLLVSGYIHTVEAKVIKLQREMEELKQENAELKDNYADHVSYTRTPGSCVTSASHLPPDVAMLLNKLTSEAEKELLANTF